MKPTIAFKEFCEEAQGRTFADVISRAPAALKDMLEFLSDPGCQRRMKVKVRNFDVEEVRSTESHLG